MSTSAPKSQNTQTHPSAPEETRPLDPNSLQRRASRPDASVWVSASAGTGKTKVLTDRVLRLLLPREDRPGQIIPGAPAHKILCLTFTKAGASEMAIRISKTLAEWAILPLDAGTDGRSKTLPGQLERLLGRPASPHELQTARRLFTDVMDVPGGLKIMTIHAFCQSILGRFPLEAGITAHAKILEESQSQALMSAARRSVFMKGRQDQTSPLGAALDHIARTINEDQFLGLLDNIARERRQLQRLLKRHFDPDGLYTAICAYLQIQPGQTPQDFLQNACEDTAFDKQALQAAARAMIDSAAKTDLTAGNTILNWLAENKAGRIEAFKTYESAFLKKTDGQLKSRLVTQKCDARGDIAETLAREGERIITVKETLRAMDSAALTRDILLLGNALLNEYEKLKTAQGALDFDDLILKTLDLLSGQTMGVDATTAGSWVHYKLDQGLDHILVDEAQDTNPEQWQIIEALCNEFYTGEQNIDTVRSVFIVGDEKQSIYSFQRASPEEFSRMQSDFRRKTENVRGLWDTVPMNISFRSTKSVLAAVDAVFAPPENRKGLSDLPIEHSAFRRGQAGAVTLWPAFESDETGEPDLWTPLKTAEETQTGRKKLARHIALTIQNWLKTKQELASKARPIRPGDIMILVRTRSALVAQIARELKNLNIPVSGLDRMVLTEELAVQDVLAAAEFTLQPLDDLTLAALLKSPLIGLDEDQLFALAAQRGKTPLWHAVLASNLEGIKTYLQTLRSQAGKLGPFALLGHILQSPCPTDKISARRAIIARLGTESTDPLDELLHLAHESEYSKAQSLQSFLHEIRAQTREIKRENAHGQDDPAGEVQIMTVHGSKGLQAPIVILPDTIATAQRGAARTENRLLWPGQTGLDVPLWSPRKDMDPAAYTQAMNILKTRLEEEYRRLLYVAMTRAEDQLYIGGALNKNQNADKIPEGCWYSLIRARLETLTDTENHEDGTLRLTNPQIHDPETTQKPSKPAEKYEPPPAWLHKSAPPESEAMRIVRPSHIADSALSPLQSAPNRRFLRGNLTHKLLQLLPTLTPQNWGNASQAFLERYGDAFNADIRTQITRETLEVLNHPDFAPLFGPGSRAEVPITGQIEGKGLISGQIDRLYIDDQTLWIIDYKTNRPPPENPDQVPQIYHEQMRTYAAVLRQIYPARTIKGALLWTDGPFLMPLDLETV